MLLHLRRSLIASLLFFVLCGIAYPLVTTGIAQVAFRSQANGSLEVSNGHVIGSTLVGQTWTGPRWFYGRPDAYDPMGTGASNLGPRSKVLVAATEKQVTQLRKEGLRPDNDLVTGSGSGVDPDISPQDAQIQVAGIARARGLQPSTVQALVNKYAHGAELGFLGASYVDVLELNLALSKM